MDPEIAFQIIREPIITEKATRLAEGKWAAFKVSPSATKIDVRKAVELIFGVQVSTVNMLVTKGKSKRFRGIPGKRSDTKKAYVRTDRQIDVAASIDTPYLKAAE